MYWWNRGVRKTIRMMNTVRDNLSGDNNAAVTNSGSFGKGLDMKGSDIDSMITLKLIEVYEDPKTACNPDKICFAMATDDTQPGFTLLRLLYSNRKGKSFIFEEKGLDVFLSNNAIKQLVVRR